LIRIKDSSGLIEKPDGRQGVNGATSLFVGEGQSSTVIATILLRLMRIKNNKDSEEEGHPPPSLLSDKEMGAE
jgi:hypothetical protein